MYKKYHKSPLNSEIDKQKTFKHKQLAQAKSCHTEACAYPARSQNGGPCTVKMMLMQGFYISFAKAVWLLLMEGLDGEKKGCQA